jgi:protein-S-isoprenylcysteine O-methyltransferase Ste14
VKIINKITMFLAKKRLLITRVLCIAVILEFILNFHYRIEHIITNPTAIIISIILIVLGAFIRSWSAGIIEKRNRLVMEGPYALCRNPLYAGSSLILLGAVLFVNDIWAWLLAGLLILVIFPFTIKKEELTLSTNFPEDWKNYTATTGRYFPKKLDWQRLKQKWSFQLWLKNREYNMFLFSLLLIIIICVLGF